MTDGLALAAVIALVFVNAFFVAAEFAIVTIRRARVDALVRPGSRRAKLLSAILGDLDAHISAIQLAITAVGLAIGGVRRSLRDRDCSSTRRATARSGWVGCWLWWRCCYPTCAAHFTLV